jgi:hypothetical protein
MQATDRRAGCGKSARPVRREGRGASLAPTPIKTLSRERKYLNDVRFWSAAVLRRFLVSGQRHRQGLQNSEMRPRPNQAAEPIQPLAFDWRYVARGELIRC